jgi:hypothetical protein
MHEATSLRNILGSWLEGVSGRAILFWAFGYLGMCMYECIYVYMPLDLCLEACMRLGVRVYVCMHARVSMYVMKYVCGWSLVLHKRRVFVCVRVYLHVLVISVYAHANVDVCNTCINTHEAFIRNVCVCVYIYMYIHMHVHKLKQTNKRHTRIQTYAITYIYTCTYVHVHMHTHTLYTSAPGSTIT